MQLPAPIRLALLACAPYALAHSHTEFGCVHDEVNQHEGGVRDSGYFFSPQAYEGDHLAEESGQRRRRLTATTHENLRVQINVVSIDALSSSLQSFLSGTLLPSALDWVQHALRVEPVSSTLLAAPFCSSSFSGAGWTQCASATAPTCGVNSDGSSYSIPSSLLASITTCSSCSGSGSCSGCSTSSAGAGATDADFVLFVSAVNTGSCSGGTLAYASTCQRDQWDRPIFGYANFCPSSLSAASEDFAAQRATAVHEVMHALGFSSGSWPLFREADGTPLTARESDGLPASVSTLCGDGVTRTALSVDSSTLEVASVRGSGARCRRPAVISRPDHRSLG
jgi:leishmanolysin-like peptidase